MRTPSVIFGSDGMTHSEEPSAKAAEERLRCKEWLLPLMQTDQPRLTTKAELCVIAMRELSISKSSFDFAWIDAIEQTGRRDWYDLLRQAPRTKN